MLILLLELSLVIFQASIKIENRCKRKAIFSLLLKYCVSI